MQNIGIFATASFRVSATPHHSFFFEKILKKFESSLILISKVTCNFNQKIIYRHKCLKKCYSLWICRETLTGDTFTSMQQVVIKTDCFTHFFNCNLNSLLSSSQWLRRKDVECSVNSKSKPKYYFLLVSVFFYWRRFL